jgi:hypothetical protein
MFSFLYNCDKNECCICYSIDGKSDEELNFDMQYNNNQMNYPLLSLSTVYECNCINNYAHNRCLLHINKCPTCRKLSNPKLYVYTLYDYYLPFLLN